MRVNNDSYTGWTQYDQQTVANTDGTVHHGASAVQNARGMGEAVMHGILPDRIFTAPIALGAEGFLETVGAIFFGLLADVVELIIMPFFFLWDLGQMIAHLFMSAFNKGSDGTVDSGTIAEFDFVGKNLGRIIRRDPVTPPPLDTSARAAPAAPTSTAPAAATIRPSTDPLNALRAPQS